MKSRPPYSAQQLRHMADGPSPSWDGSVFVQLAWMTELLASEDRGLDEELPIAADLEASEMELEREREARKKELEHERHTHKIELERERAGRRAELERERHALDECRKQIAAATERAAKAEEKCARLGVELAAALAEVAAAVKERDEKAAALMTGEIDPETGTALSWKDKAELWNVAFIVAKRRAERAEADLAVAASRLKDREEADAKRAEESRRPEASNGGLNAVLPQH